MLIKHTKPIYVCILLENALRRMGTYTLKWIGVYLGTIGGRTCVYVGTLPSHCRDEGET